MTSAFMRPLRYHMHIITALIEPNDTRSGPASAPKLARLRPAVWTNFGERLTWSATCCVCGRSEMSSSFRSGLPLGGRAAAFPPKIARRGLGARRRPPCSANPHCGVRVRMMLRPSHVPCVAGLLRPGCLPRPAVSSRHSGPHRGTMHAPRDTCGTQGTYMRVAGGSMGCLAAVVQLRRSYEPADVVPSNAYEVRNRFASACLDVIPGASDVPIAHCSSLRSFRRGGVAWLAAAFWRHCRCGVGKGQFLCDVAQSPGSLRSTPLVADATAPRFRRCHHLTMSPCGLSSGSRAVFSRVARVLVNRPIPSEIGRSLVGFR